ncbi:hypothetical protein DBV15_12690, partial [Temnothorax longispinosus]
CDRLLSRPACVLPLPASSCLLAACLDLLLPASLLPCLLPCLRCCTSPIATETKHPGVDGTTNGESHLHKITRFGGDLHPLVLRASLYRKSGY